VRDNERTRSLAPAIVAALTLAACGGSTADHTTRATTDSTASPATKAAAPPKDYTNYYPPGTHKATHQAIAVITKWSDELRAGHIHRAASYFAVPAIVQNATPPLKLTSREDVFEFNRALPCGAHLVKTLAGTQYTVATFVLTERPGSAGCGATGKLVAAAFLLSHGKIKEWRRVLVPPPLGPAKNLQQPTPAS
jgi:hypothetical protein